VWKHVGFFSTVRFSQVSYSCNLTKHDSSPLGTRLGTRLSIPRLGWRPAAPSAKSGLGFCLLY